MFKANRFGLIGIVIATIGIVIAIAQDDLRVKFTPESLKLVGQDVDKGFSRAMLAHVAENHLASGLAGALGVVAMAWNYVLIGVVIPVVRVFLAAFS